MAKDAMDVTTGPVNDPLINHIQKFVTESHLRIPRRMENRN